MSDLDEVFQRALHDYGDAVLEYALIKSADNLMRMTFAHNKLWQAAQDTIHELPKH